MALEALLEGGNEWTQDKILLARKFMKRYQIWDMSIPLKLDPALFHKWAELGLAIDFHQSDGERDGGCSLAYFKNSPAIIDTFVHNNWQIYLGKLFDLARVVNTQGPSAAVALFPGEMFIKDHFNVIDTFLSNGWADYLDKVFEYSHAIAPKNPSGVVIFFREAVRYIKEYAKAHHLRNFKTVLEYAKGFVTENRLYHLQFISEALSALKRGIDLGKYASLYLQLKMFHVSDDFTELKAVINSGLHEDKKLEYLAAYSALKSAGIKEAPLPNEEWLVRARELLEGKVKEKYTLTKLRRMSIINLAALSTLELTQEYDERAAIRDILEGRVRKPFKTGKVYKRIKVSGAIDWNVSPARAVELLVYGLYGSKDPNNVQAAADFFREQSAKLKAAQRYINSRIAGVKFFQDNKEDIGKVKTGDIESAKKIVKYLRLRTKNGSQQQAEALSDIITLVEATFTGRQVYEELVYRTQTGTSDDLFNNQTTFCCTFHPTGEFKQQAALFTLDEDIAVLHLVPKSRGQYLDPISAAITFFARDGDNNKILVVDSIEGGNGLPNTWKEDYYNVIYKFAQHNGCTEIIFNTHLGQQTVKPKQFIEYVASHGLEAKEVHVEKYSGTSTIERYGARTLYLESFGITNTTNQHLKDPRGRIKGYSRKVEPRKLAA